MPRLWRVARRSRSLALSLALACRRLQLSSTSFDQFSASETPTGSLAPPRRLQDVDAAAADADLAYARAAASEVLAQRREGHQPAVGKSRAPARAARSPRSHRPIRQDGQTCRDFLASYVPTASSPGCRVRPASSSKASGKCAAQALEAAPSVHCRCASHAGDVASRVASATPHIDSIELVTIGRRRGISRRVERCATPTRSWGFPRVRTRRTIKSAYPQARQEAAPDANKHDPKAASRFAELNAAYEIVGDEDKRKAFDRGEIDAEGKPRFQGFEGFGARPRGGAHGPGGAHFESFSFGPGRLSARPRWRRLAWRAGRRFRGHFARDVRRPAARRRRGTRHQFEQEDFGAPAGGQDLTPR